MNLLEDFLAKGFVMIVVIPDGMNYKNGRGHFFVNQIDQERGDNYMDYLFDLIQYIDDHLQTK